MAAPSVNFILTNGQAGGQPTNIDKIAGLMTTGLATTATTTTLAYTLNTTLELYSITDLERYGISANYDTVNNVRVWKTVSDFFLRNKGGKLWFRMAAQTVTLTQLSDRTLTHAKQLCRDAQGEITVIGVTRNPITSYVPTLTTGLDGDVITAIPNLQALADEELNSEKRPIYFLLEGRSFNGLPAAVLNLRGLATPARNVSVVIAQDNGNTPTAANAVIKASADVGTVMGVVCAARIGQKVGEVESFNLETATAYIKPGLTNSLPMMQYSTTDIDTLHGKGYTFIRRFPNYPGSYICNLPVCALESDDYNSGERVRAINKAIRLTYRAIMPKVNKTYKLNPNGTLPFTVIDNIKGAAVRMLTDQMVNPEEISDFGIDIDPSQNLITNPKLQVRIRIQPLGATEQFDIYIGFVAVLT